MNQGLKTHVEPIHTDDKHSFFPDCFFGVKWETSMTWNGQLIHSDTVWEKGVVHEPQRVVPSCVTPSLPSFVYRDNNSVEDQEGVDWSDGGIWLPFQTLP